MSKEYSKVYYMHFRQLDLANSVFDSNHRLSPNGGMTVAYRYYYTDDNKTHIQYSVAKCDSREHYNKKIGRAIAGGRLLSGKPGRFGQLTLDSWNWFDEFESHLYNGADKGRQMLLRQAKMRHTAPGSLLVHTADMVANNSAGAGEASVFGRMPSLWSVLFG